MSSALTQGRSRKVCKTAAGFSEILITELANIVSVTVVSGIVTAITMATGKQFWKYLFPAETANLKVSKTGSGASGSYRYAPTVTFPILGLDTSSQEEIDLLLKNSVVMIAKNNAGDYWLVGQEFGLDLNSEYDAGTAMGDDNQDMLTFTTASTLPIRKVTSGLIAALILPAV